MTDEEMWSLGRECGLMTTQPGTRAFDAAMFAFARRLIECRTMDADWMNFEAKRLRRVAVLLGISVPESDEALAVAAGGVLGEVERAIERAFKEPNAEVSGAGMASAGLPG